MARVCARVHSEVRARSRVCGAAYLFTFFLESTIVRRRGDCVYLSLFSNAGGREKRKRENSYLRNFDRENITNTGVLGAREETQL